MCYWYKKIVFITDRWYWIIATLVLFSLIFSLSGMNCLPETKDLSLDSKFYNAVKIMLVDNVHVDDEANLQLRIARWLGVLVISSGVIGIIGKLFRQPVLSRFLAIATAIKAKPHIIILGIGKENSLRIKLIETLVNNSENVVIIEPNKNHPEGETCRQLGAIILNGPFNDQNTLNKAKLKKAKCILLLSENTTENFELLNLVFQHFQSKPTNLTIQDEIKHPFLPNKEGEVICVFRAEDPSLIPMARKHYLDSETEPNISLRIFCPEELVARTMLRESRILDQPKPLSKILLLGTGGTIQLGETLIVQAAKDHFINQQDEKTLSEKTLEIHILDNNAQPFINCLTQKFEFLEESSTPSQENQNEKPRCILAPFQQTASHCNFRSQSTIQEIMSQQYDAVFICLEDQTTAIRQAIEIRQAIDSMQNETETAHPISIIVSVPEEKQGIASILDEAKTDLVAVGINNRMNDLITVNSHEIPEYAFNPELEMLAQVMHQQYLQKLDLDIKKLAKNSDQDKLNSLLSKDSRKPWSNLDDNYKNSNRALAARLGSYLMGQCHSTELDCIYEPNLLINPKENYSPSEEQIQELAKQEHENWCEDLFKLGWTYKKGDSNSTKKTSPYLVSWDQLGDDGIKEYDCDIISRLSFAFAKANYRICKKEPS